MYRFLNTVHFPCYGILINLKFEHDIIVVISIITKLKQNRTSHLINVQQKPYMRHIFLNQYCVCKILITRRACFSSAYYSNENVRSEQQYVKKRFEWKIMFRYDGFFNIAFQGPIFVLLFVLQQENNSE